LEIPNNVLKPDFVKKKFRLKVYNILCGHKIWTFKQGDVR